MCPLPREAKPLDASSSSEFAAWMDRNGLSLTTAAEALDMTRRMMAHYRTGSRPVPRVVALACIGWETERTAH